VLTLRPYQSAIIDRLRVSLRSHRAVLLQLPTGGGKTVLTAAMIGAAAAKGHRCHFHVHRQELIDQTIDTFKASDIPHGVIAAGYAPNPFQPVQIASIDTLRHRLGRVRKPTLCVWDEAHHLGAKGWRRIMDAWPDAVHVGLTATPERLDGKGLDECFDAMVQGPTTAELIAAGFLSPYRLFAPSRPDLSGVATRAGDYASDQAAAAMDKPTITGDAIQHYLRLARDRRAVAFCVSVQHSQHVAAEFRAAGVVAWHIDGKTERAERRQAIDAFRRGEIKVLTNVGLVSEGFDLDSIEGIIALHPTQSLALWLQQVGRALRPMAGKTHALILDHAGNTMRHGLPDDEREWSLQGRAGQRGGGGDRSDAIRQCKYCYRVFKPAPVCPSCGRPVEGQQREVEQVDGDLAEIDPVEMRRQRAQEQAGARTLDELVTLGRARGMRHPEKWAGHVWSARVAKGRAA
jgi:DNA repair protein RadD